MTKVIAVTKTMMIKILIKDSRIKDISKMAVIKIIKNRETKI